MNVSTLKWRVIRWQKVCSRLYRTGFDHFDNLQALEICYFLIILSFIFILRNTPQFFLKFSLQSNKTICECQDAKWTNKKPPQKIHESLCQWSNESQTQQKWKCAQNSISVKTCDFPSEQLRSKSLGRIKTSTSDIPILTALPELRCTFIKSCRAPWGKRTTNRGHFNHIPKKQSLLLKMY